MDVINIISFLVVYFILCGQIVAQEKIAKEDKHKESNDRVFIENNENIIRKAKENLQTEKSKFETPPPIYTKNEYEYKPVDIQNPSNTTSQSGIAENLPKVVRITKIPQETFQNVKKKIIERAPSETVKPPEVHSKTVESSELQRTHQLETASNNPNNCNNKATDRSNKTGNSGKHLQEDIKNVYPESKSGHNLKSVPLKKDSQHMKVEPKTDSVYYRSANGKKGKTLYFEEIDIEKDHSETNNDNAISKPVFKVQKAESGDKSGSPVSEDSKKAIVSPEIQPADVRSVDIVSINSKNSLLEVPTGHNLKSAINTEAGSNNNCHRSADPVLLKTTIEKSDFYEENNLNRRLDPSSKQDDQEKPNLINFAKSILDETIDPPDDIIIKTYKVNELIETYKNPDGTNDQKCTSYVNDNNSKDDINAINYVLEPQTVLDSQYHYVETAQYVPPYSSNYQRLQYDQNSIPQQNYYYNNLAQQYYPYNIYPQGYRGQNYYPKTTGSYYTYPAFEYNNQFKPDYTYTAPSFKYPFEDQLQQKVQPKNNNYIANWDTQNYQNQPRIYSGYYQPLVYDFSKVKYPKEYLDRIWRTWQNTEIQIKRPKTKGDLPGQKCAYGNFIHKNTK